MFESDYEPSDDPPEFPYNCNQKFWDRQSNRLMWRKSVWNSLIWGLSRPLSMKEEERLSAGVFCNLIMLVFDYWHYRHYKTSPKPCQTPINNGDYMSVAFLHLLGFIQMTDFWQVLMFLPCKVFIFFLSVTLWPWSVKYVYCTGFESRIVESWKKNMKGKMGVTFYN